MKIFTEEDFISEDNKNGFVKNSLGDKFWYKDGNLHREDGPAAVYSYGAEIWYKEGEIHREDGPAIKLSNGRTQYRLNSKHYSYNEWYAIVNGL